MNRLKEYRPFGVSNGTHYTYYIDNLRKSKDDTYFIWLDGNMVYEFTSSDSDTYTYGHRLLYSDVVKYVLNSHGDVVALLNNSGIVTKRYDYDAFGNELNIDEADANPFRYCAEYFDAETGQIYLRARYYSPVTGRFTQLDPIKDGLNWYAYCGNNPTIYIDRSGLYYLKDMGNGKYELRGTTFLDAARKIIFGDVINNTIDKFFSYVDGPLKTDEEDAAREGLLILSGVYIPKTFNKKLNQLIEAAETSITVVDYSSRALDNINSFKISYYDSIVFNTLDSLGISREVSYSMHEQFMDSMYSMVKENSLYFSQNLLNGKTLFEIDIMIRNSDNSMDKINELTTQYKNNLMHNPFVSATADSASENFFNLLYNYNMRLNSVEEYIISCK